MTFICKDFVRSNTRRYYSWHECACGEFFSARNDCLARTTTCGCHRRNLFLLRNTTHGMHDSVENSAYRSAKARCNNNKHPQYNDYGGRGIKFLFKSFQEFFDAIGPRPTGQSLDRRDNNGNYEVGNVRWTTRHIQNLNTRRQHGKESQRKEASSQGEG